VAIPAKILRISKIVISFPFLGIEIFSHSYTCNEMLVEFKQSFWQ